MKNVVVIGAGPAGLTAAYELAQKISDYNVTVLETSGKIGGLSQTVDYNGNRMDIGGHRFFSKDKRVLQWWAGFIPTQGAPAYDDKKLFRDKPLVVGGPDPEKEDNVMLIRDRVSRIYFESSFFDYPISLKPDTIKSLGLGKTLISGFSYLKSIIFRLPETSLENFYINRFGRVLYNMFFEGYTEKLWGRHPREISADWGAQRIKGLSISALFRDIFSKLFHIDSGHVETSLIEQFIYPKYGPGQLWERVAEKSQELGVTIKMQSTVTGISKRDGSIDAVEYISGGKHQTIAADIVISTMPLRDLVLATSPPGDVGEIANGLPYRDFITIGILARKLKLKNHTDTKTLGNIVPDCWIYIQDSGIKMGRLQIFNNWSPYMLQNPDNTVWIGTEYFCTEGDDFWCMDNETRITFAVNELIKMDIICENDVLDCHSEKVKKAYPAYFDTYDSVQTIIDYIDRHDNLYCIGRNGQHRYNNMDHSMVTAFRAVDNIITGKKDKSGIWSVNTDVEYHEEIDASS